MIKELFLEVIKEASEGNVLIDEESWPIGFNTLIYENNHLTLSFFKENYLSTLVIKQEEFIKYLEIYLQKELEINRKSIHFVHNKERNNLKLLISYLFVNASITDFENPIAYIKKRISFLEDKTFSKLNTSIDLTNIFLPKIENVYLEIKEEEQDVRMETPNCLKFSLTDSEKKLTFPLPSISYGICNENGEKCCYIYSILNPKHQVNNLEEAAFSKKINRYLYKINAGLEDEEVKDVSVSAVLSLTIFFSLLKEKKIDKVKAILYLPVRYLSREIAAMNHSNIDKRKELLIRNDNIQANITNKFLTTFRRVMTELDNLQLTNDFFIDNGYIEIKIDNSNQPVKNSFLNEVTNKIK